MSELAQAVVVCNVDGRILLYNNRARLQFKALVQGAAVAAGGALIGLGRSIFSILERNQIDHALDVVRQRLGKGQAWPTRMPKEAAVSRTPPFRFCCRRRH
jgi:DNA polymerase-3 subunit epsilon